MLLQSPLIITDPTLPLAADVFIFLGVKLLFIIAAILYLVFAFVVIRQISVMKNTLITPFSPMVSVLGYIHFLVALGGLLFFIVLL